MTSLIPTDDLTLIRALVERVGEMDVTDTASNQMASAALRDIKTMREQIEKRVTALRRPHTKAADAISAEAKPYLTELKDGEEHLRGIVTAYMVEQARVARMEEEARELAYERALIEGRASDAQEIADSQLVPVERDWRPAGVSLTSHLKCEVTDLKTLVCAVGLGQLPLDILQVSTSALLTYARANGREDASIPGVRVWSEQSVAAAAR